MSAISLAEIIQLLINIVYVLLGKEDSITNQGKCEDCDDDEEEDDDDDDDGDDENDYDYDSTIVDETALDTVDTGGIGMGDNGVFMMGIAEVGSDSNNRPPTSSLERPETCDSRKSMTSRTDSGLSSIQVIYS